VTLLAALLCVLVFAGTISVAGAMSLAERRVSAAMQYRYGPNRVGPFGLLQPLADGIKFLFKEEAIPAGAHPLLFRLAPMLAAGPALMTVAVVPVAILAGEPAAAANLPVGALYFLALGSLGVYGVILGGWSSDNKYSLLGSLRAGAQMLSYELTLTLSVASAVLVGGSLSLGGIVRHQAEHGWTVLVQPVAFLTFLVAAFAETNRHPFDFAECEPELVGGFHTEYSSMKFALFFIGEYGAMVAMSGMMATLFFGGPSIPFLALADTPGWASVLAFGAKMGAFLFFFLWVRWSLPRLRYDQLMSLGWRVLLPLALANFAATGVVVALR
jgi:NADH-quinone oxidoreductase subunit H